MRRALYQSRKYDLGCPKTGQCSVFQRLGGEKDCGPDNGCQHFLSPAEEIPATWAIRRLVFLTRLESMVNVGCKFAPNDLDPRTWSELVMLALERQRMEDLLRKGRDTKRDKPSPEAEAAFRASRKELGMPEGGGSLFPQSRLMK